MNYQNCVLSFNIQPKLLQNRNFGFGFICTPLQLNVLRTTYKCILITLNLYYCLLAEFKTRLDK